MNGKRSKRRSASHSSSKINKNSNVQMYKLVDPIVQSLGIILFIYSLDVHAGIPSRWVLFALIGWQMLSVAINLFLGEMKLLKAERAIYFIAMLIYLAVYYFYEESAQPSVSLNQIILISVGVVIAFWYNVICYREFRKIFGAINRGNNR